MVDSFVRFCSWLAGLHSDVRDYKLLYCTVLAMLPGGEKDDRMMKVRVIKMYTNTTVAQWLG